jgi:8-oxo-dGTP diphosphatase
MTVEHDYPTFHITMHAYLCTLVKGDLVLKEHNDSTWVTKEELLTLDFADADKPIVNKLI